MKSLYALILFLTFSGTLSAQVGIGTEQPNTRAVLDLRSPSNNQGFLAPRLSTVQRTASAFIDNLTAAENGLLVFDADEKIFYYWMFPAWKAIEAGSNSTVWRSGNGVPTDGLGVENDFYLDILSGDVYKKVFGVYALMLSLKGDKGDKGDPGVSGPQGPIGLTGAQGIQGLKGDKGDTGAAGATGAQGIPGLKGDKGDTGAAGTPGATGAQGIPGVKGDKGDTGAAGTPGATGAQGIQGVKGDKGDIGATGPQGPVGPQGPAGADGTSTLSLRIVDKPLDTATEKDDILIAALGSGIIYLPGTDVVPGKVFYIRLDAGADKQPVTIKSEKGEGIVAGIALVAEIILDNNLLGITISADLVTQKWYVINTIKP